MTRHLLDANVLIALAVTEHVHRPDAKRWLGRGREIALCPIVEGALVRYLLRTGESGQLVEALLGSLYDQFGMGFWRDRVSYRDVDLADLRGHRQATDAYLVALAASHDARLVTFDRALAASHEHVDLIEVEATG